MNESPSTFAHAVTLAEGASNIDFSSKTKPKFFIEASLPSIIFNVVAGNLCSPRTCIEKINNAAMMIGDVIGLPWREFTRKRMVKCILFNTSKYIVHGRRIIHTGNNETNCNGGFLVGWLQRYRADVAKLTWLSISLTELLVRQERHRCPTRFADSPAGWNHGSVPNVCEIEDIHVYTRERCVSRVGGFLVGIVWYPPGKVYLQSKKRFQSRCAARCTTSRDPWSWTSSPCVRVCVHLVRTNSLEPTQ